MASHAQSSPRPGLTAWLLLAPLLAWLAAFVVLPMVILLVYNFLHSAGFGEVEAKFTLDNYRRMLSPVYVLVLWRSVCYAALTTALCVAIGYPVAYFIGRTPPPWRHRLLILVMIPFWTSFLVRAYAWFAILMEHGLLKSILEALRIT